MKQYPISIAWLAKKAVSNWRSAKKYITGDKSLTKSVAVVFDKAYSKTIEQATKERDRLRVIHGIDSSSLQWVVNNSKSTSYYCYANTSLGLIAIENSMDRLGYYCVDVSIWGHNYKPLHDELPTFQSLDDAKAFVQEAHELRLFNIQTQATHEDFVYEFQKLVEWYNQ